MLNQMSHPTPLKSVNNVKRLHLAASRFERLQPQTIELMATPAWIHLGESESTWQSRFRDSFQVGNWTTCARILYRAIRPRYTPAQLETFYSNTDFRPFNYRSGDRFDFPDNNFDFVCSEHFLEHLFIDEALELLKECHRILKPGGVVRIVTPDADLRTYEKPETAGFPGDRVPWTHPDKYKSRWSIYSLNLVMQTAHLKPNPLMYCDKHGQFIKSIPASDAAEYANSTDKSLIHTFDYIKRLPSLIVDGIKI